MALLPRLRFIEQYDPADTTNASQPYAYVADFVHEVSLGVGLDEVTTKGIGADEWAAMMELRDRVAPEEKVTWFVVTCGDEERYAPPTIGQLEAGMRNGSLAQQSSDGYSDSDVSASSAGFVTHELMLGQGKPVPSPEEREPRGLKKLFGSARLKSRGKR